MIHTGFAYPEGFIQLEMLLRLSKDELYPRERRSLTERCLQWFGRAQEEHSDDVPGVTAILYHLIDNMVFNVQFFLCYKEMLTVLFRLDCGIMIRTSMPTLTSFFTMFTRKSCYFSTQIHPWRYRIIGTSSFVSMNIELELLRDVR